MTAKRVSKETARLVALKTDYLKCGICLDRLKQPKFLNCEHSYCEDCLKGCTPGDATKVVCPRCGTETPFPDESVGVASIPTNPFVTDILYNYDQQMKFLSEIDPSTRCEACERGNRAIACCLSCEEYLCRDCEAAHRKLQPRRAHHVERLDWVPNLDIKPKTPECNAHPGRPAIFACSCCNKRICLECVGIDYKPREIENCRRCHRKIEDVNSSIIKDKLPIATHNKDEGVGGEPPDPIQSAVTESDIRKITQPDVDLEELKEALAKRTQEEITRVEDEEKELIREINALENRELMTFRQFRDKQRTGTLKCRQIKSIARSLIASDCPYLVVTIYPRLLPILEKCTSIDVNTYADDLDLLTFMPEEMRLAEPSALIGRVDCLMTLQEQWGRDGKIAKEPFEWGHGIAVYSCGDIIVCDRDAKKIVSYSRAGEVQFEVISPPERSRYCIYDPCDVAVTSDDFLLVVDRTSFVKIFDDKGLFLRAFNTQGPDENPDPKVCLWSVAVDDKDRIVAADSGRCMVTLHFSDGTLIRRIQTKCNPGFVAINSQYQILISAYPLGKVEVMDYEGNLLFWFNCMIEGRRFMIGGITVDSQDNMWIGMYDLFEPQQEEKAGSVHAYTPDGLYLGCVARQLYKPVGIAFTREGDLAVVDYHRVRIFV